MRPDTIARIPFRPRRSPELGQTPNPTEDPTLTPNRRTPIFHSSPWQFKIRPTKC